MDEKGSTVLGSFTVSSEDNVDCLYPMFFGVSCAFFALRLLPEPEICENDVRWLEVRNRMLKGSAHLLGLLIWRIQGGGDEFRQKLEKAQKEVEELKKRRSEEARANERVMSIVASREQSWFDERRRLRQHVGALVKELRVVETKGEKSVSELSEKLKESEAVLQSKERAIEEGEQRRREVEERLKRAESVTNELKESVRLEGERHSGEILKQKTAFIELVSNQRQLEAEMGRAARQVETMRQELDSVTKQKQQSMSMAQRLSMELVKMRRDLEQKDQILSAMLRKPRVDAAKKQMFLKETRSSKAKRKQAELETARWKAFSEPKHERHPIRNMLSRRVDTKSDAFLGGKRAVISMDAGNIRAVKGDSRCAYEPPEFRKQHEVYSLASDSYSTEGTDELFSDVDRLENWVNAEAETYKITIEQRHNLEVDAFVEQLRLKDEKIEATRWRLLSMELELKRLQSHVEGLNCEVTQLRQENTKLEALLIDREAELHSLKEQLVLQFNPPNLQKLNFNCSLREADVNHDTAWSKVKVVMRKPSQKRQEMKAIPEEIPPAVESEKANEIPSKEIQEGNGAASHLRHESNESDDAVTAETSTSLNQGSTKKSSFTWKMDIHALGVSYKIKRLKQQFLMLERMAGKQESCNNGQNNNSHFGTKAFYALTSLLNKQVDRYQSLQAKTDDICQRMHENNLDLNRGGSAVPRTDDETKKLEHFLEETFQLQRYIVATGQKLMEVQAKIASGFVGDAEEVEKPENFDMKRFADSIRTLFREVQRGLEVRISRIIGDLEGTLACDGIIHLKK